MSLLPPLMKVDRNGDDFRPLGPALKRVEPEKAPTKEELFEAYDHAPAGQPVPPPLVIERFSLCETLESVFQSAVGVKHAIGVAAGLAARHSPWDDEGNLTDPRDQEALNEFYSKMAAAMESATRPPLISYDFGADDFSSVDLLPWKIWQVKPSPPTHKDAHDAVQRLLDRSPELIGSTTWGDEFTQRFGVEDIYFLPAEDLEAAISWFDSYDDGARAKADRQDVSGLGALPPKSDTAKREYERILADKQKPRTNKYRAVVPKEESRLETLKRLARAFGVEKDRRGE